jgi:hypothetical protein
MRTGVLPTGDVNEGWLIPIFDILKPYLDTIPPHKLIELGILRQKEIDEELRKVQELNSQRIKELFKNK